MLLDPPFCGEQLVYAMKHSRILLQSLETSPREVLEESVKGVFLDTSMLTGHI